MRYSERERDREREEENLIPAVGSCSKMPATTRDSQGWKLGTQSRFPVVDGGNSVTRTITLAFQDLHEQDTEIRNQN